MKTKRKMKIICKCGRSKKANLEGLKVPKDAVNLACNYCPKCEHKTNDDYWEDWFEDKDGNEIFNP